MTSVRYLNRIIHSRGQLGNTQPFSCSRALRVYLAISAVFCTLVHLQTTIERTRFKHTVGNAEGGATCGEDVPMTQHPQSFTVEVLADDVHVQRLH